MKGLKFVQQYADRVERSRFTLFPDLPKHIQELVILKATKIQTPRLFRWLITLRSVNGLFNDTIDLQGGWGHYIARDAFMIAPHGIQFRYSRGHDVRFRLLQLAIENDTFFQVLIPYVTKILGHARLLGCENMTLLFNKVVKFHTIGSDRLNVWYCRLLNAYSDIFKYKFENIEIERSLTMCQGYTIRATIQFLTRGYKLSYTPRIIHSFTITKSQWKKILTIGHKSTIEFLLKHMIDTNEDHYQQLIRWANSFKEPKKKKRKTN